MSKAPHVQASFINALAEEGTREELVQYLQEQWNETCAAKSETLAAVAAALEGAADTVMQVADRTGKAGAIHNSMGALQACDAIRALITAPVADKALAERLLELSVKSTQDPLNDDGRYFNGDWHADLTQCSHGDTGNYSNKRDGQYIAALWNAHRSGQLITLAEAQAMVAAERERAVDVCKLWHKLAMERAEADPENDDHEVTACTAGSLAAAIRASATGTREGM